MLFLEAAGWMAERARQQGVHERLVPTILGALEDRLLCDLPGVAGPIAAARAA